VVTPWLDDGDVKLYHGDAAEVLSQLPAASVQTCVTSLVARHHGRRSIGIDLSESYLGIAARRLQQLSLLV
jgi:DNA modification methylase